MTGGAVVKGQAGKAVQSREASQEARKYQAGKEGKPGPGRHVKVR